MSWFRNPFRKKPEVAEVPALRSKPVKFLGRVLYPYKAQCTLTYNGKPVRTFESTIKAPSKTKAIEQIRSGYKVEVGAIHRIKG